MTGLGHLAPRVTALVNGRHTRQSNFDRGRVSVAPRSGTHKLRQSPSDPQGLPKSSPGTTASDQPVGRWWKNNELPEQQARGECVKASVSTGAGDELAPAESAAAGASSRGRSGEADAAGGAAQKKPRSVAYAGSKGGRASPRTIARGAYARSAGVRASASTSAEGAYARSSGARASARTCAWSLCK